MFDNLKKKLGSFRKDAEEAAEENVEEVDEDELEELEDVDDEALEGADEEEPEAESEGEPEPEAEDAESEALEGEREAGSEAEVPEAATAAGGEAVVESEVDAGAEVGAAVESDAETAPEAEPVAGPDVDAEVVHDTEAEAKAEIGTEDAPEAETEVEAEYEDEGEDEDEDEAEAENDDGGSVGFGAKAKSLVRGKFVIEEEDLEGPLQELELALLSSDVEMSVADEILENIRDELVGETRTFTTSTGEVVENALKDAIHDVISVGQFDFDERIAIEDKPVVIIFTGVNGVGKTTSIAKLDRYFEERGYSTVMANGDTYRAGANEQIQEHAEARDTKLITHEQGGDPAAVLYDAVEYAEANDIDVVLGDTAGRLHTNEGLMDQLEKIGRVVGPDMTLFVDEAVAGQDAVNRAREFNEAAEIDGTILTKADADSNGGAAISIAHVTGKPILFLGVGQGYDDLERFDPDEMVERLLEEEE
ncbi:signal recognition particle-docking protein FtsY [Natrialbaceae archaeon GCM10025810]|uniref:signal recognition particle-docking protein FtsY n=1 Tax=Halovalidus salilacus TaxID=3075124 RepID=UPI00360F3C8A